MKLKLTFILTFILLSVASMQAQATMGLDEKPESGMLLQLKTIAKSTGDEPDAPNANKGQGLLLPRVKLASLTIGTGTNLATTINGASGTWDLAKHVGLVVCHIKDASSTIETGVYVWNYDKAKDPEYEWLPVSLTDPN